VRVTVIEDNPGDVVIIREALRTHRLEADLEVFEDGEAAINHFRQLATDDSLVCPSLILIDVNLPRADGFEVLRVLRESPKCVNIPVIVMTSSAALPDRVTATALQANAYFQKPTSFDAFLRIGELAERILGEQQ